MRPKKQVLDAAGFAAWVPVNHQSNDFGIGIGVNVSDGATLTYSVQHTFDNPYETQRADIARASTVATVTFKTPHGKKVGDSINVTGSDDNLSGVFDIASVPSDTTLTYTVADTGATSLRAEVVVYSVFEHDELSGLADNQDAGYVLSPSCIRLNCTAHTSGTVTANYYFQGS